MLLHVICPIHCITDDIMEARKRTVKSSGKSGKIPLSVITAAVQAVHVVPEADDGWVVRTFDTSQIARPFSSKKDAVAYARTMARSRISEIVIHDRNGRVRCYDMYGRKSTVL
jgi:hypothetical protein